MSTRDRLISWGMEVPPTCLLCGISNESSAHFFFECQYSLSVWNDLLSRSRLHHPYALQDIIAWLSSLQDAGKLKTVFHLVFQASIYHLWKERNSRLHNNASRSSNMIMKDIILQLRSKLYSLDREDKNTQPQVILTRENLQPSYLYIWFDRI